MSIAAEKANEIGIVCLDKGVYLVSILHYHCHSLSPSPTLFFFQVGRQRICMKKKMEIRSKLVVVGIFCCWVANGNMVFPVQHKFKGREKSLSEIVAHDSVRRGRFLSAVDFNLGGNGHPSKSGFVSITLPSLTHFSFFKLAINNLILQALLHQNRAWISSKGLPCPS